MLGQRAIAEHVAVVARSREQRRMITGRFQRHEGPRPAQARLTSAIRVRSSCLRAASSLRSPSSRTPGGASHLSRPSSTQSRTSRSRRSRAKCSGRSSAQISISSRSAPVAPRRRRGRDGEDVDDLRQTRDRGLLEQVPHRDVDAERRTESGDDPSGDQRVTARVRRSRRDAGRGDPSTSAQIEAIWLLGCRARSDVRASSVARIRNRGPEAISGRSSRSA